MLYMLFKIPTRNYRAHSFYGLLAGLSFATSLPAYRTTCTGAVATHNSPFHASTHKLEGAWTALRLITAGGGLLAKLLLCKRTSDL